MTLTRFIVSAALMSAMASAVADDAVKHNSPGALNPVIPGYFADPTVKKFGDDYYVYATTDGSGAGFGPAQVWTSRDFVNWTLMPMNWPDSHWIWAPDVMQNQNDGKYYFVYCQPCIIHCGVSDTPRGPWTNILGESEAVLVPDRFVHNAITLDGQTFVDDDGSIYMYWGTWGIYDGFGCGAGKLSPDMKSFTETRLIPNTEATDFFEAPFVLKRGDTYYFMYSSESCHDETYHVQYATSKHPLGPYTYKGTVLRTSADGTVHGPGHHSILEQDGEYYIVYHRHDNPHSNRGFHRQVCIDRLEFDTDGNILPVTPTHSGVGALAPSVVKSPNLAFGAKVKASSHYDDNFLPEYAVDDNNGTLWRPATMGQEWLEIDLGKLQPVRTVWTQWEYGTQFYRYLIETSADGKTWTTFSDKRSNRLAGSPMVDFGDTEARYVRITFLDGQKAGFPGAIWNVKVFGDVEDSCPQQWVGVTAADWDGTTWHNNEGQLGGGFKLLSGHAVTARANGRDALVMQPGTTLRLSSPVIDPALPHTLSAMMLDENGDWTTMPDMEKCVTPGHITLSAPADKPLTITNVRYYNRRLAPAELAYDAVTDIVRQPVADRNIRGCVMHITADDFHPGDTAVYIPNHGAAAGAFVAQAEPSIVTEIDGHRVFAMDSSTVYHSDFMLPATIRDNAPYTLRARFLNPTIELNECLADFTTSHDEMEKIMLVNGTEPRCGIMNHYGWYEDAGWEDVKDLAGKWQDLYVSFDGRIERVYINGRLVSEKDIQLLVKPSQMVILGRNAEDEWPFTGYISSIELFDECIPYSPAKDQ